MTVAVSQNGEAFAGKWSFDGHGLNHDGGRVAKMSGNTVPMEVDGPDHTRRRNPIYDRIGKQLEAFANSAARLSIDKWEGHPPHLFLTVKPGELHPQGTTVLTVEVEGPKGKTARFSFSLAYSEYNSKVEATVTVPTATRDYSKSITGRFVDWVKNKVRPEA